MTNREWLNSLSNEDFIKWLFERDEWDVENNCFKKPHPRLEVFKLGYTNTYLALKQWLESERYDK